MERAFTALNMSSAEWFSSHQLDLVDGLVAVVFTRVLKMINQFICEEIRLEEEEERALWPGVFTHTRNLL